VYPAGPEPTITTFAWVVFVMFSHAPLAGAFERLWPAVAGPRRLFLSRMYGFASSYARYATRRAHSLGFRSHHDLRSAQYCFAK